MGQVLTTVYFKNPEVTFFAEYEGVISKTAYNSDFYKKFTQKTRKSDFFCIIKITKSAEADPETILEVLKTNPWPFRKKNLGYHGTQKFLHPQLNFWKKSRNFVDAARKTLRLFFESS